MFVWIPEGEAGRGRLLPFELIAGCVRMLWITRMIMLMIKYERWSVLS